MKASGRSSRSAKRERGEIDESRPVNAMSSTENERSSKSRRTIRADPAADDPVFLARKALEMFNKEMEGDEDYVVPDTTPGMIGTTLDSRESQSIKEAIVPPVHPTKAAAEPTSAAKAGTTTSHKITRKPPEKGTLAWQKATTRTHMFSDDPSIL
jgi:hypothetical protein